jgi:hypothetical protein
MKILTLFFLSSLWLGCTILSCTATPNTFALKIPAIVDQHILALYTCDGENTSPAIFWSGEPKETKSYVLIVHDPDAPHDPSSLDGSFVHWAIYNIPAKLNHLPKGISRDKTLPNGTMQGRNSFHRFGYDGPCPPANETHHYTFTFYALNKVLNVKHGAAVDDLQNAMQGHIIATTQLMGTYASTRHTERAMTLDRPNMLLED